MGPNNNETSGGLQLPAPQPEQAPDPAAGEQISQLPEKGQAASTEQGKSAANAALPSAPLPMPTFPSPPSQNPGQSGVSTTTSTSGLQASDESDLIEKEWVHKAKQIVEKTRDDPYKQSEDLTVVKADYIKKRYNKTIKLNK